MKLFNDWEIQLLVLLSFAIQIFLFFTGGLRRYGTNVLISLSIWIAYLGADTVAVYALGYLSRQEEDAHSLAFFWAPFLLIHLGGQDTITAFALEDNNLWLRHLLNLVVQVILVVYVFWKSMSIRRRHSVALLVSGAFVFVVGVIKYGERIWSLRCARFESLEESSGWEYERARAQVAFASMMEAESSGFGFEDDDSPPVQEETTNDDDDDDHHAAADDYGSTVLDALIRMPLVFSIFVSRASVMFHGSISLDTHLSHLEKSQRLKSLEICLGLMYDDLYTKALELRTLRGVVLRCVSLVCALVAFVVFVACDRRRYGRVDTAITYSLFIGCLLLEVCGLVRLMASPWTWACTWALQKVLKLRVKLNEFSWFLLSSDLTGWSQKRPLWSNAMGQYNFYGWLTGRGSDRQDKQPRYSFSQRCMALVRRLATLLGLGKEKIFFISKLLDTEHVKVDGLLECLVDGVDRFVFPFAYRSRELPNLGAIFRDPRFLDVGFGSTILSMHVLTEQLLCKSAQHPDVEANAAAAAEADHTSSINLLMEECRKLSRYMIYLIVACPSLLPLQDSSVAMLEQWQQHQGQIWLREQHNTANPIEELVTPLRLDKETLEEIKEVWIRLIIYAASKSEPEQHAAQLARGGELLTFVWLQLRFNLFGRSDRIELTNKPSIYETFYALHLPSERSDSAPT